MIEVRLQDGRGNPSCESDVGIDFPIPTGDGTYRLLCYIDPYGDTIFNGLQMETFLVEWETIRSTVNNPATLGAWSTVKKFAQQCKVEPHLYLRFIGD